MPLIYAPDADPLTPGVLIIGCEGNRPTRNGYANWNNRKTYSTGWAGTGTSVNTLYAHHYQSAGRIICGASTKLWEDSLTGTGTFTVTDVSRGAGYTTPSYTGTVDDESDPSYWAFTSFGAYVIASNKFSTPAQVQTTKGGAFADLTGSPPCSTLTTFKNFVIAGNCGNYGSVTGTRDMVAWSALGDHTSWVPSAATQAGYQQIIDVPGRIVAVKPLGDAVVVYKSSAIWLMRFVGPPSVFSFQLVHNQIGVNAAYNKPPPIVDIGRAHLFVGQDDIYIFDGANVRSVTKGRVQDKIRYAHFDATYQRLSATPVTHDPRQRDVMFWTYGLVYNYELDKWGTLSHTDRTTGSAAVACEASATSIGGGAPGIIGMPATMVSVGTTALANYYNAPGVTSAYTYDYMRLKTLVGNQSMSTTLQRIVPRFRYRPTGTCSVESDVFRYYAEYATTGFNNGAGNNGASDPGWDGEIINNTVTGGGGQEFNYAGVWDSSGAKFDLSSAGYLHELDMYFGYSPLSGADCTGLIEIVDLEYVFADSGKKVERRPGIPPT